jgi:hypothetical protein
VVKGRNLAQRGCCLLLPALPIVRVVGWLVRGCLALSVAEKLAGYQGVVVVSAIEPFAVG